MYKTTEDIYMYVQFVILKQAKRIECQTIRPQYQDNSPPISGQFAPEEENDKTTAYKILVKSN